MCYNYSSYNIILKEDKEFVYLYNSFSGALCKLEKEIHDHILNNIIDEESKCKFFDELLIQGFIKPINLNEYNKIVLTERISVLSKPIGSISYVIAPTLTCNLNCEYCFENSFRNGITISDQKLIEVADYILKRITSDVKEMHIGWFGGEPLVAYEQIVKFSEYLIPKLKEKQINYHSSMISNGVLLTGDRAKILSEKCALKQIQITIDGTKEIYCARKRATAKQFDDLFKNIKVALETIKITIRLNCDGYNYDDLKKVAKNLIEQCDNHKNLFILLSLLIIQAVVVISSYPKTTLILNVLNLINMSVNYKRSLISHEY